MASPKTTNDKNMEPLEKGLRRIKSEFFDGSRYSVNTIVNVIGYVDRKLTQDELAKFEEGVMEGVQDIFLHSCKDRLYPMSYDEGSERTWGNIEVIRDNIHGRHILAFKDLGVIGWDVKDGRHYNYGETVKVENIHTQLFDLHSESEEPVATLVPNRNDKFL